MRRDLPFKPTFWPTVITLPALAVLVGLGVWQLERLQWKTALIEERQLRASGPAIALPQDSRVLLPDLLYRPVTVTGRYDHLAEMRLLNRVRDGKPGVDLITPLVRSDRGGIILVNRGWVPLDRTLSVAAPEGEMTVTGIVRAPGTPGWFVPDNRPAENQWYYMDLAAMAEAAGMPPFADYYVYATDESPAEPDPEDPTTEADAAFDRRYPAAHEWRVDTRNDHLGYAITWFSLATALLVVYVAYHVTLRRRDDDG